MRKVCSPEMPGSSWPSIFNLEGSSTQSWWPVGSGFVTIQAPCLQRVSFKTMQGLDRIQL